MQRGLEKGKVELLRIFPELPIPCYHVSVVIHISGMDPHTRFCIHSAELPTWKGKAGALMLENVEGVSVPGAH